MTDPQSLTAQLALAWRVVVRLDAEVRALRKERDDYRTIARNYEEQIVQLDQRLKVPHAPV